MYNELITQLQSQGVAIIVGYNSRPDLQKKDFDAPQSNSGVYDYSTSEFTNNLYDLGYNVSITCEKEFDHNDKNTPKPLLNF